MKVLQVNSVYKNGSTGKIVNDIHVELLSKGVNSIVCFGNGRNPHEKNVYKVSNLFYEKIQALLSRVSGLMYGGCLISTYKLISIIKKESPDVVHLHCLNGHFVNIYKLLTWLNKKNIKTVLTLHAEFMYTGNCGHSMECEKWHSGCGKCPRWKIETKSWFMDGTHRSWIKMKKAFDCFDNIVITSVSTWLMNRAKDSPILCNNIHKVILNGLDINTFSRVYNTELIDKYVKNNNKIIFHATPVFNNNPNHIKGGYYLIKLAEKMVDLPVTFLVAGHYEQNLKVPSNVVLLGNINNQDTLAQFYSIADLTLLTSKKETFSMITAESLCCGTPVVGFKAGAPELITIPEYSEFVNFGDVEELYHAVIKWLKITINNKKIEDLAKQKYSKTKMCDDYIKIYYEVFRKA